MSGMKMKLNIITSMGLLLVLTALASVLSMFNLALFGFGLCLAVGGAVGLGIEIARKIPKHKDS